ncbi:TIGR01620 family protein [Shewanella xiamenensis]|uniref:TIGR01620 family protein n=1 Tax=Shewanella xiamenensis TaxID=332186 RepID=UPI001C4DF3AF|nr:TIGR01620 family protein [Shewanella xiamenensis]MBW0297547.1 TIGR01620 family protein [Shewanella xiamenensis]
MRKDPLPHSTESQINESQQSVAPITTQALKKQQVFDAEQVKLQSVTDELKSAQMFAPQTPIKAIDDVVEETLAAQPQVLDVASIRPKLHQSRRRSWLARLSLMALILLTLVQTGLGLRDAWVASPWLFSFYGVVLGLVGSWAIVGAVSEYRKLKRLKQVADTQDTGARLALSMQMGEADSFIDNIVRHYPDSQGLQRLRHSLKDEHNDAEKVLLFEDLVLTERDELAKKVVRRYAAESAVLLAASPLAALDMAIILWRNQRMLRDVAACYGIELGYWSRIKLIRSIVINIIYAGTSELVTDLGTQLLSVEMTGKLSARLAQGLGGGLLTARLGYQAMALCRPIGFREEQRPKLSKVHQELLIELKQFAGKLLTKDGRDALKSQLEAAELKTSSTAKDK